MLTRKATINGVDVDVIIPFFVPPEIVLRDCQSGELFDSDGRKLSADPQDEACARDSHPHQTAEICQSGDNRPHNKTCPVQPEILEHSYET